MTGLGFSPLNDAGNVAFFYHLADGRSGIAIAAPEPAGPALLTIAGAPAVAAASRRRRQPSLRLVTQSRAKASKTPMPESKALVTLGHRSAPTPALMLFIGVHCRRIAKACAVACR